MDTLMEKYPFIKNIDFSKYRLPESARHFSLDGVRYSRQFYLVIQLVYFGEQFLLDNYKEIGN